MFWAALYLEQLTSNIFSAKSYYPRVPSSVKLSCSKILLFSYGLLLLPTRFMQLNLNLTASFCPFYWLYSSKLMSSKLRDNLKLSKLKGAIRSSKKFPGSKLMVNSLRMVQRTRVPSKSFLTVLVICPSKIRLEGNRIGFSLLNCI